MDFFEMYREEKKKLKLLKKKSKFEKRKEINIEEYKLGEISDVYYINEFINKEEEKYLLNEINKNQNKWNILNNRR
jgi:hypothetical protein